MRFRFADGGIALHFGRSSLAERVEVPLLVADLLDGQHVHADAHLLEIGRRFARQLLREALAIAVDLFDRQRAQDGPQMALQRLEDDLLHGVVRHAEKPLGGRLQRDVVTTDLHVGHGLDGHRYALQRVRPPDLQRNRHHIQVQVLDLLEQRNPERRASADHPIAHHATVGELALAAAQDRHRIR